jgi:hypothetical protein
MGVVRMRHSVKGALLSGAVYPGLGQIALKRYARGFTLMLTVSAGLFVIVKKTVEQALAILEKIQWEGGPIDLAVLSGAAAQATGSPSSPGVGVLLFMVVSCWVFGTLDAYGIGRKKDLEERAACGGAGA